MPLPEAHNPGGLSALLVCKTLEHGEITIAPHYLFSGDRLLLDAQIQEAGYLAVSLEKGRIRLRATSWVGFIPLNERLAVDVRPRVPIRAMEELLEHVAVNKQRVIQLGSVSYTTGQLRPQNLMDLLTLRLVHLTRQMRLNGLDHRYRPTTMEGRTPVGSISPFATKIRQAVKADRSESVSSAWIRTIDTPANRMVLATLQHLHGYYMRLGRAKGAPTKRAELGEAIEVFRRIGTNRQELSKFAAMALHGKTAKRPEYAEASAIAHALLGRTGIQSHATGQLSLSPVVFNLEEAFEGFLRARLSASLMDAGLRVFDGNLKRPDGLQGTLYSEPKLKQAAGIPVKPDIVVCRGDDVLAVIDVKYKPYRGGPPDRADVEQVVTYAQIYETQHAIVALPQRPANTSPMIPIGQVGRTHVAVLAIDLNTFDLAAEVNEVARSLKDALLNTPPPAASTRINDAKMN